MFKTWLLVKLTLLYTLSTMVIAGLIWFVQRVPHPSPAALPTIYLFVMPLISGNVLLLSWCQVYSFRHNPQAEQK